MGIEKMNTSPKLPPPLEDDSPIRAVFCLKKKEHMKKIEEIEECFILDFDPSSPNNFSNLSVSKSSDLRDETDVSVLAENGKVACRDYPHPRHLCAKFPFEKTSHESHCKMCFCYVCEKAAPCGEWTNGMKHCDASDDWNQIWRLLKAKKNEG